MDSEESGNEAEDCSRETGRASATNGAQEQMIKRIKLEQQEEAKVLAIPGPSNGPCHPPSTSFPIVPGNPYSYSHPFLQPAPSYLPPQPQQQQAPPPNSSGSSHSSESSTGSHQTSWSFEEQFKQVRQELDKSTRLFLEEGSFSGLFSGLENFKKLLANPGPSHQPTLNEVESLPRTLSNPGPSHQPTHNEVESLPRTLSNPGPSHQPTHNVESLPRTLSNPGPSHQPTHNEVESLPRTLSNPGPSHQPTHNEVESLPRTLSNPGPSHQPTHNEVESLPRTLSNPGPSHQPTHNEVESLPRTLSNPGPSHQPTHNEVESLPRTLSNPGPSHQPTHNGFESSPRNLSNPGPSRQPTHNGFESSPRNLSNPGPSRQPTHNGVEKFSRYLSNPGPSRQSTHNGFESFLRNLSYLGTSHQPTHNGFEKFPRYLSNPGPSRQPTHNGVEKFPRNLSNPGPSHQPTHNGVICFPSEASNSGSSDELEQSCDELENSASRNLSIRPPLPSQTKEDVDIKTPRKSLVPKRGTFESHQDDLYEISDDPKRKEFLDDLFSYMQRRGSPINRLPIMAKSVLDLYELYNLVIQRGGLVDVINKKLWQEIIKGLHLPSSITSAAFTLRTQYMKYLYPYECERNNLSTPSELQAAIDGNRREGRRGSYGTYPAEMLQRNPAEMLQRSPAEMLQRSPAQQSPLSLVTSAQRQPAVNGTGVHHHPHHHLSHLNNNHIPTALQQMASGGEIPSPISEIEYRMVEYIKLLNREFRNSANAAQVNRQSSSPEGTSPIMNPLEMSRLSLWGAYNNTSPQDVQNAQDTQNEALNLVEKREDDPPAQPPAKRPSTEGAARIRIASRGDGGDDSSIVVSMDINGIMYQGVLFAQNDQPSTSRAHNNRLHS